MTTTADDNDRGDYRGEKILAINHVRMITAHEDGITHVTTIYKRDGLGLMWILDSTIEE